MLPGAFSFCLFRLFPSQQRPLTKNLDPDLARSGRVPKRVSALAIPDWIAG
jgi:hypothetical protein